MDLISDQLKKAVEISIETIEKKQKITKDNAEFLVIVPSAIYDVENGFPAIHLRSNEKKRLKIFLAKYLILHPDDKKAVEFKRIIE